MQQINTHIENTIENSLGLNETPKKALRQAYALAELTQDKQTFFGESCFNFALETAKIVLDLQLGQEATAAAIAYITVEYSGLNTQDVTDQLGTTIGKLITGIQQMGSLTLAQNNRSSHQADSLRRMLLAIVSDVRVVVIKLAEQLCVMRAIKHGDKNLRVKLAEETSTVYAPLANRLGIHQLKWELEDLSFYYLNPEVYKHIAKQLQQRRVEREQNIKAVIETLQTLLKKEKINAEVYGRAKHIYSIHRKMQRKSVNFDQIYDAQAIRVLVPAIEDCYTVLSLAHNTWTPISEEFDDYIQNPKPNGYQSVHTAVIGPHDKNFEIQIRTHQMHEDAEKGVAAHWIYKEGGEKQAVGHEQQIAWLRQLLQWQKELTTDDTIPDDLEKKILEDRVYVFSPKGEIVDLPYGATPLDFAYTIHTEVGHRCRGAKVNGKIVPLTYTLNTGERVEVLTASRSQPSRDWLILQRGYLKTTRARAKVLNWFKHQDSDYHLEEGKAMLERELNRLNLTINLDKIANQLNFKSSDSMLTALGNGDMKMSQILNLISKNIPKKPIEKATDTAKIGTSKKPAGDGGVMIYGVGDMVTRIAQCCKPVPGDPIIGYITIGKGVSIHQRDCKHIIEDARNHQDRIIEVQWRNKDQENYAVDIVIEAYDRTGLVRDITNTLANEKINVSRLDSHLDKNQQTARINLTIEISDIAELGRILDRLHQLPNVYQVVRA
ncbi:MAG: GTP diphosphokinase [Pseudomonadota bacterium]